MMIIDRNWLPDGLLDDVKAYLGITWSDDITETRIRGYIASSIKYINGKLGREADYTVDGSPRELLFERVRYARDAALDVFENNYLSQILAMQNEEQVNRYVEKTEPDEK